MYSPLIHSKSNLQHLYLRFGLIAMMNILGYGVGCLITGNGLESTWYRNLEKAPWTSTIFFIGLGWIVSLLCFTFFLVRAWDKIEYRKHLVGIFVLHWMLNFAMDPIFFQLHWIAVNITVMAGLVILLLLSLFAYYKEMRNKALILIPYILWIGFLICQNLHMYLNN